MSLTIKHLASGDEAILEHLVVDVFDEAIDLNNLSAYLAESNHHMIVAIHNGVVVGQIRAVIHKHPVNSILITWVLRRHYNVRVLPPNYLMPCSI